MHLLWLVERHLRGSGTTPTRFGREAAGDPRFVFDLRRGRRAGPKMEARVLSFLREAKEGGASHASRDE